ncbi:T-cell activation inhibitor, mitochondrial [Strongyloides ratti]|uniref:T-cell activation inhibitor, mitochondrial n=1 Tax=Strongyloides ratti TaxID=34506 RepID=A0A090MUU8_STRRB|nr:T-cell activation inhibitor, mitochondrial [Strongyloides ratti]CEF62448.1 T-cell activation inhibitor, mitochondrial [Strongyloides ratti]
MNISLFKIPIDLKLIFYRLKTFTAQQAASALRPFYFEVHPDRFPNDPIVRQKNEKNLQIFNGYLNELFPTSKKLKPIEVHFSIKCKKTEVFKNISIPLCSNDPKTIVRTALQKCNLNTDKVPKSVDDEKMKNGGLYISPTDKMNADMIWRDLHAEYYKKKKKGQSSNNELLNVLSKNRDIVFEKMKSWEHMQEICKDEIEHLKRVVGIKRVIWNLSWEQSYMKRCLMGVSFMYRDANDSIKKDIILALNNCTLLFGRGSYITCDGNIQFGADDVPQKWLELCMSINIKRKELSLFIEIHNKLKSLLGEESKLIYNKDGCLSKTIHEYKNLYLRLSNRNKNELQELQELLKGITIEVVSSYDELNINKCGHFFIPCNVEFLFLKDYIKKNIGVSKYLSEKYTLKMIEAETLKNSCKRILQLKNLTWDDNILMEDLRKCILRLEESDESIKNLIIGMNVIISTNPKITVLNDGTVSIPINWI